MYRYSWPRWVLPLVLAPISGGSVGVVASWINADLNVVVASVGAGAALFACWALYLFSAPYKFVLRGHVLYIHWLWRAHEVATGEIEILEPPGENPNSLLSFRYNDRDVQVSLTLGKFDDFRTELILRGARVEPEKIVTVLGTSRECEKVPLMLLLKDRARMDQTAARDHAIQILKGKKVLLRLESKVDAQKLRRELSEMGVIVQHEKTA